MFQITIQLTTLHPGGFSTISTCETVLSYPVSSMPTSSKGEIGGTVEFSGSCVGGRLAGFEADEVK